MAAAFPPHVNVLSSEMESRVGLARPNVGLLRRKRFEWYKAFAAAEYTPQRVEQFTLGLRGTDIDLITTPAQLRAAALRSPSLVSEGREDERDAHPLANNHWTTAKRHIMFR